MRPLRKHITTLLAALCCCTQAFAQTYGNEWIEYAKTYYKISVPRTGIYRIPFSTLNSTQGVNLSGVEGDDFNLFNMGNTVPYYFHDANGNNLFDDTGDFIEFYGKINDGSFDTNLYPDANYQPNSALSLFNDTAIYYLAWNTARDPVHLSNITNNLVNLPAKEQYYMRTVRKNGEKEPIPGRPYTNASIHESVFDDGEGITMGRFNSVTTAPGVVDLATPDAFTGAPENATLNFNVISMNNVQHNLTYKFNQLTLANEQFNGFRTNRRTYSIPLTSIAGNNGFVVQATASPSDNNAIAYAEVIYPSQFKFQNSTRVHISLNAGTGARYIEMTDFNARNTSPILYDLSNNLRIVGTVVPGNPSDIVKYRLPTQPANAKRNLFVTTQHADDIITVTSLKRVNFTNYYDEQLQGSYIILSHAQFIDGVDRYPDKYAKYRESIAGGLDTVVVVDISQLYDQFAYGIKKHPLSIRNFIDFALDKWTIKPRHLFIIGKGREYWQQDGANFRMVRNYGPIHAQCLVPTFGTPGSDALLTATRTTIAPRVAVGRLSVENAADINHYLEKVIAYEALQRQVGDPYQTIADKAPMKRIMHMSGGASSVEQTSFAYFLNQYENIIEDTLFGGDVYTFKKTSSAPIQIVQSEFIRELINTGVSLITFFGHSSANSFDFSIDDPDDFQNFERYPIILSNGCYTGNIYNQAPGISEDFVLTPNKAAIAFISTIGLSLSHGLAPFSKSFYENMGYKRYGSTLGQIMQESVRAMEIELNGDVVAKSTAEEMTLHGDPGLRVNPHAKPDYALEAQNVTFIPNAVTTGMDSFEVRIAIVNLGRAIPDSMDVSVVRTFPGSTGGSVAYVQRIRATYFADTVYFTIPVGSSSALGLNQFRIKVENANEIDELSETNNELGGLTLNITSEDVIPIYPYEFAIVPQQGVTLKASTANPFAPVRTYRMEIDTTELFNSPLLRYDTITQSGGVLKWTPPVTYMDSVVYYWRVGVDGENEYRYSSFIYLANEYPGWNQSHYYQYQKDQYNNLLLDNDRTFKYVGDVKVLNVRTTGQLPNPNLTWDQMGYNMNATTKHVWNCGGPDGFDNGIVIAVFDSASGNNWISKLSDRRTGDPITGYKYNIVHKNQHCKDRDFEGFDFPTYHSDPNKTLLLQQRIVDFINSVPKGDYILIYSINEPKYHLWSDTLANLIQALGSIEMNGNSLRQAHNSKIPWAFFVQKGYVATASEMRMNSSTAVLDFNVTFSARWNQGTLTTPLIGPAFEWGSMHWKYHALEPLSNDQQKIDIIGVTAHGAEMVIDTGVTDLDYSIQDINAATYPYIRLRLDTRDDTTRTPTQLDYWRILYKKVPEAALNPAFNFAFRDSISLGESIDLTMAVENVTEIPMDSMLVKYTLLSSGNTPVNEYVRYDSLRAFETWNLNWLFNTNCNCLGDINTLQVEINPIPKNSTTNTYDQLEQHHFNNIATLQLKLAKDRINPLLDVTFDGVHILDGDIVSAEPEILIQLKDENKFLLLNDTSLVNVFLIDPNKVQTKLRYDQITMRFEAAAGSNNVARVWLKKFFELDGEYTLLIQAEDRSRNISGTYGIPGQGIDYRISFKVVHQAMITNVLNYPNPFTSSTRFVFTLTGVRPPDFFKIQIMTVSGKIVRELTQADLGQLKIGKNITDYAWDGTDAYGDPLANGLYLYRVVASIDGQHIQKWDSEVANRPDKSTDKYFKSGFGKMYLAR